MLLTFLISYFIIGIVITIIVCNTSLGREGFDSSDYIPLCLMWILFVCFLLVNLPHLIKEIICELKEAKHYKKENNRKIVEEALFDLRR